jgi:2-C-methyl-D-erythritol 2,4-cyclodiphosphate synthase
LSTRSGIGYDSHRLVDGRRLVLGGVEFDAERGLEGHSDADVLSHAITDALLGAAGLGDIGQHFPDSDERYRDADSLVLLSDALASVRAAGFEIVHVDATVVMERPKLADSREAIRDRLAEVLGVPAANVNIKATTGEGIGFVGRGEGVAAVAVATLAQRVDG